MSESSHLPLAELLENCKDHDNSAWHRLIDLVAPVIFAICKNSRLSRDESFDIYGQVCLELLNSISSLSDPEKIYGFVTTITRRQIFSYYRSMKIKAVMMNQELLEPEIQLLDPEQEYLNLKKREILLSVLEGLPNKEAKLLRLLFLDQRCLSYREISQELHMPESSIGPTRARALKKLYRKLKGKLNQI
jgi:RNA polymerase sigma factor (sigma-70 family)